MNRRFVSLIFPQMNTALNLPLPASNPSFDETGLRAAKLKQLLIDLSKDEEHQDFRSILREAADRVRQKAFGFNRIVTKRKIINLIREFEICEMEDFLVELKLPKKEIKSALDELLKEEKVIEGNRRRWQEPGKHYNLIYSLKK